MKLSDLKLGQEITIYKYQFNLDNNIVVSKLKYYVHNIIRETWSMFNKKENKTESHETLTLFLDSSKEYEFERNSLTMKSRDDNDYQSLDSVLGTKLYSLTNDDETLNKFKSQAIQVLNNQVKDYLECENNMHKEYIETLERVNKLMSLNSEEVK